MIPGTPKADGIAISDLNAEIAGSSGWRVTATIRYVDTAKGTNLGYTKQSIWSADSMRKLGELVEQLEKDVAKNLLRAKEEEENKDLSFGAPSTEAHEGIGEYIGKESI